MNMNMVLAFLAPDRRLGRSRPGDAIDHGLVGEQNFH